MPMKTLPFLPVFFFLCMLVACTSRPEAIEEEPHTPQTVFVYPEIPDTLRSPAERQSYLLTRFWREYDFADTSLLSRPGITEQGFVNFLSLFRGARAEDVRAAIDSLVRLSQPYPIVQAFLLRQAGKYLYDTSSPSHNEAYYQLVVKPFLSCKNLPASVRSEAESRLALASKNPVGSTAADFAITSPDGAVSPLSTIQAEQLLVVFYDAASDSCRHLIASLQTSKPLVQRVNAWQLRVLLMDVGSDAGLWKATVGYLPHAWLKGHDGDGMLRSSGAYDLHSLPSLYLLDAGKKVILKQTTPAEVLKYWEEHAPAVSIRDSLRTVQKNRAVRKAEAVPSV